MRTLTLFCAAAAVLVACGKKPSADLDAEVPPSPEIRLEDPAPAAWMPAGEAEATGRATGLSQISINGQAAPLTGDTFSAPITLQRGVNVLEAHGVAATGHEHFVRHAVLAGDFADPGAPIDRAAAVRINRGGLRVAVNEVASLLDPELINASLAGMNPVYQDSYGLLGWDAVEVSADIGSIAFGPPALEATPASGVLTVELALPDLDVWAPVSGSIVGFSFNTDVWVGASRAEVIALLTVDAANGQLQVDLGAAYVNLVGFWYDTSLLPGQVESLILVNTLRGALENAILEQIEQVVPPLLQAQLASLDLSFSTELLGKPVSVEASVAQAAVDHEGVLLIADLDVSLPGAGAHTYAGYLSVGTADPRPGTQSDVSLALSDDLLNRVLFEAWRAGMLSLTLSSEDGTLQPILLHQLGARDEATVIVEAALPPVVIAREGELQAQIGELEVTILTPRGDMGERLELAAALFIELDLTVKNGELALGLVEPQVQIMVRDSDWSVSNETITEILTEQLPIDTLLLLVGNLRFPLPSLGDITIQGAEVSRENTGVFTEVAVDLR